MTKKDNTKNNQHLKLVSSISPKKITKNQKKIVYASININNIDAIEISEISYITQLLAMINLPYKKPTTNQFVRKNGNIIVTFTNIDGGDLPYGRYPRLIIIWLITQVVLEKERIVDLGASLNQFMKEFDLPTDGRTMKRFREQADNLFNTMINIKYEINNDTIEGYHSKKMSITNENVSLWSKKKVDPNQIDMFKLKLKLTEEFYDDIVKTALPIDKRAVKALIKPLSLDLYVFLTSRVYRLKKETAISFQQLHEQLGSNYQPTAQGLKNFQRDLKTSLTEISILWSDLDYELIRGRLLIRPCNPHIKPLK